MKTASFPALNRGSDISEQHVTEGAFLFSFLVRVSMVGLKQIHAFWLHFVIQNSNQLGKLFPAVITSHIDACFLEGRGGEMAWLYACL